ncbi:MAG: E3 binding domain-containing protein, partial [Chloroflexi bacterium]|nr:E3 binding domain-containing protein [Chloroflexota bacterium]
MATEVIMPQMGFDVTEATLVRWLKNEGEPVKRGEPIAEIETEKSVLEVEAFGSGVLRRIMLQPGQIAPVGQVIGVIAAPDEKLPEIEAAPAVAPPPTQAAAPIREQVPSATRTSEPQQVLASPVARRMADEMGIDLGEVRGTGPEGRITKSDIEAYAEAKRAAEARPAEAPPPEERPTAIPQRTEDLSRMRQAIARRMAQSKREAPHFYT